MKARLSVMVVLGLGAAQSLCGGEIYHGHWYGLTADYGDWAQAEAEAVAAGGHLATVNDAAENAWLSEFAKDTYARGGVGGPFNCAWIGYAFQGGAWRWVSGEPVTFTNFAAGWNAGWAVPTYLLGTNYVSGAYPDGPYAGEWDNNGMHDSAPPHPANFRGIIEVPLDPAPPDADAGGPYTITSGQALVLDGNESWYSVNSIASYQWDLDNNGVFETDAGSNAVFSVDYDDLLAIGLGIGGPYSIGLQVMDSLGESDTASGTLTITPEPTTIALLAFGALTLARRKRPFSAHRRTTQ